MRKTRIVRQLRNGQITIPKEFREALGLRDDDMLSMTLDGSALHVTGVRTVADSNASDWYGKLYEAFAPIREGYAKSGLTEEEINAEIDAAIREVRAAKRARKTRAAD